MLWMPHPSAPKVRNAKWSRNSGPRRYFPPRHPSRFEPSCLEFNGELYLPGTIIILGVPTLKVKSEG